MIGPGLTLIGQFDSPFVRRVGIALRTYGMTFEHRAWSVFTAADRVRAYNPLGRVPVLVLADGVALIESGAILDYLDQQVGEARALVAARGAARVLALRRTALAVGVAEKAVALLYEARFHDHRSASVVARIEAQIGATLGALEADLGIQTPFWQGAAPGHADIALGCATAFLAEVHPHLLHHAQVQAHGARCEVLPAFSAVRQNFVAPV